MPPLCHGGIAGENGLMPAAAYDFDNMDAFFTALGELQSKFMSLEYWLRTFLFRHERWPFMRGLDSISVGDIVEANPFTNYDPLGVLISKYNGVIRLQDASLVIDRNVVDVRDALAHGRIYWKTVKSQPRLLKFSKPDKVTGKYRAQTVETLDPAKLAQWNYCLSVAMKRLGKAL